MKSLRSVLSILKIEWDTKKAEPILTLPLNLHYKTRNYSFLLFTPARPNRPRPKSSIVAGSGAGAADPR